MATGVFQVFILRPDPFGNSDNHVVIRTGTPDRLEKIHRQAHGLVVSPAGRHPDFLTHKRGTWIALAIILAVSMLYLVRRRRYLLLSILLVIALILPLEAQRRFTRLDPKIAHDMTILHRLELYNFALHIWKTHPFMGIGLRSFTHEKYLPDYHLHNQDLHAFIGPVAGLQTLDNMLLTGLVEFGTVMTLFYLGLVILILAKYCRRLRSWPESSP